MQLVFLSDTHGQHHNHSLNEKLTEILGENQESILLHCGDFSSKGTRKECLDFLNWFSTLQFETKIFIAGNHDFFFEDYPQDKEKMLQDFPELVYLEDSGVQIKGVKFWGSPVQPRFYDWAFNRDENIQVHWKAIPDDIDVLLTHGPCYGFLDRLARGSRNVGCPHLLRRIIEIKPKIHACGHIHECFGTKVGHGLLSKTTFVNASYLDLSYRPTNNPILLTLDTDEINSNSILKHSNLDENIR